MLEHLEDSRRMGAQPDLAALMRIPRPLPQALHPVSRKLTKASLLTLETGGPGLGRGSG